VKSRQIASGHKVGGLVPLTRLLRERSGTTALEFAIVLPVLVLLTFAIFDSGRAFFVKHSLEHAVSNVSREALVDPLLSDAQLIDRVRAHVAGMKSETVEVQVTRPVIDGHAYIVLDARYPFALLVPFISSGDIVLAASARVVLSS
jgi:Flp pilus assembly protein TadG